ncbi:MAG TPA: hypothetical protein VHD36_02935 [Pirellulales bacterium]|nr:hypothetical protein [Pirellulales bacterium]
MNSNVGVFGWIREGVRRAVLLGFSDAVEQIGAADDKDALHPQLQSLLREAPRRLATTENRTAEPVLGRHERKRLGRTLGQTNLPASGGATTLDG